MNYDNYIVFLLGTDNFGVCKKIREFASDFGIDEIYEDCIYIAKQFNIYDKNKYDEISQYESFERFLDEYNDEILDYLCNGKNFEVRV